MTGQAYNPIMNDGWQWVILTLKETRTLPLDLKISPAARADLSKMYHHNLALHYLLANVLR